MGLLEKADQIRSGEESQEAPPAAPTPPPTVVLDPEPVQEAPEAKPKTRRRGRKPRTPRAKKTRQTKTLPAGFEEVTSGQRIIRRVSDFIVSYGWCVPIVGIFAWGSNFDPTYFIILGMLLMSFNLIFMPRSTGRTVGNWISRTTYVNSKGTAPNPSYLLIKGFTFVAVLIGMTMLASSTATGWGETSGQIQLAIGLVLLLPPMLDYVFFRFKRDNMGLWDTLFGGVWLVRTTKTAEAKGWLKRLEQLGDYSADRGWLQDKEVSESTSVEGSD
ncbi:MAG: RDD family protein [Candidatus Thalassarchaeaceae archaeon]|jgi:hypothetical protein|nr:hypothetical protein [Euryarchaeota archaeon]MDP7256693.1 RDD family protein [Candidatus Thalassarchaeaceae archaeon]MDP7649366.1 RDD family protein [Candidatus Thalassarchaeaceae archaeon]|tara:strand:+ start:2373 stop:3191 length:819 start_codon:yes stop_codon:yes gene_type:complete